jgi:hypothetical protein
VTPRIPNALAIVVGQILGEHYYSHRRLDALFAEAGAPGDPPLSNCQTKCTEWLKRASADPKTDALGVLGKVLEELMEVDSPRFPDTLAELEAKRERLRDVLGRHGLSYHVGGHIHGGTTATPTRSLEGALRGRDLSSLEAEFRRSISTVETDPPAAVTAACSTIESLCRVYIEDEGLALPSDLSIKPLWKVVQGHLGLDPAQVADDDLKRILSGLISIVDGLGALRTHAGSAHGKGRNGYRVAPRHARLALHAAHSLTFFVLETWDARKPKHP